MSFVASGYPRLTYSQLEEVWIQADGPKALAPLMAAIALAESGGQAGNTNPTDNGGTQTSWGLWQISNGTHSSPAPAGQDIYDPVVNARMAVQKYHSQGLGAWGTYTSGAYRQYLQGSVPPSTGTIPTGTGGAGSAGQTAQLTSYTTAQFVNLPGPFKAVESIVGDVAGLSTGAFGYATGLIKSTPDAIMAIGKAVGAISEVFTGFLWLLNPANDLRVIVGLTGLIVLGVAIYLIATA